MVAGIPPGVARGAWHLAEGLGGGLAFASRLFDPYDAEYSPRGQAAWDTVANAGQGALRYVDQVRRDPSVAAKDLRGLAGGAMTKLVPGATRPAATFGGELRRNFNFGLDQGEALFDVASLAYGGAELKGLAELGVFEKGGRAAKYIKRGYPEHISTYFAEPYEKGMGSHYWARKKPLPEFLGGGLAPKSILDSPLNVWKPIGVDKGAFFERHYAIDPQYHGGPLRGGGGWSGKQLGWKRYGPVGRAFYGAPAPAKAMAGGGLAGIGALVDAGWQMDTRQ